MGRSAEGQRLRPARGLAPPPVFIVGGGFAISREVIAIARGVPILFAAWGIPFVVIGLYMIFGRLYVARREAHCTVYRVTGRAPTREPRCSKSVPDANKVYRLIQDAKAAAPAS